MATLPPASFFSFFFAYMCSRACVCAACSALDCVASGLRGPPAAGRRARRLRSPPSVTVRRRPSFSLFYVVLRLHAPAPPPASVPVRRRPSSACRRLRRPRQIAVAAVVIIAGRRVSCLHPRLLGTTSPLIALDTCAAVVDLRSPCRCRRDRQWAEKKMMVKAGAGGDVDQGCN
jgi:hypothetical protein